MKYVLAGDLTSLLQTKLLLVAFFADETCRIGTRYLTILCQSPAKYGSLKKAQGSFQMTAQGHKQTMIHARDTLSTKTTPIQANQDCYQCAA